VEDEGEAPPLPAAPPTMFRPPARSTFPKIPLRPDQGEQATQRAETDTGSEPAQELDKELLMSGTVFVKHSKRGKPAKKIVSVDASFEKILWKDFERKRLEGFIMMNDVIATKRGHVSKKLLKVCDADLSLSIICSDENKTMELEAESQDMRDRWLDNFDQAIRLRTMKRLG